MIFFLGLLDLVAGLIGLAATSNLFIEIALYGFLALLFKGFWSLYTSKGSPLMLLLGLLDLSAGLTGLLFLGFGVLGSIAYLLLFMIVFKGVWTVFTTLFSNKS